METKFLDTPWIDPNFDENCRHIAEEELDKHRGQHVAYSWDGKHIVASGIDYDDLARNVQAAGFKANQVVWGYVDDPDVSNLGGLLSVDLEDAGISEH